MCYVTLMSSVYTIIYSNFAASMPVLLPYFPASCIYPKQAISMLQLIFSSVPVAQIN